MMQAVPGILLVLDPHHQHPQDREEQEISQANPKHCVGLEPLAVRRLVEVIDPWTRQKTPSSKQLGIKLHEDAMMKLG